MFGPLGISSLCRFEIRLYTAKDHEKMRRVAISTDTTSLQQQLEEKDKEIRKKDKEIREKDKEMREKDKEMQEKDKEMRKMKEEKDKEITELKRKCERETRDESEGKPKV